MHKLWKDKILQGMVFEILFSAGVCVCIMKSQEKVPLKASSDTYRENKTRNVKTAIAKQLPSFEVWPTMTFKFLNCLLHNVEQFNSLIRLAAQFFFNTRSSWETISSEEQLGNCFSEMMFLSDDAAAILNVIVSKYYGCQGDKCGDKLHKAGLGF